MLHYGSPALGIILFQARAFGRYDLSAAVCCSHIFQQMVIKATIEIMAIRHSV